MGLENCAGGGCGGPGQRDGPCAPVCTTDCPVSQTWGGPVPRAPPALASLARSLFPHSDVTFVVGREQQKVFAHRCVLACRCQAFRGMLSQGPVGSEDSPNWGQWSPSAPVLRNTPRWSPHGWWL
uniref:BTB domain-containing protein n=1 Tax=Athene cunicularia TaxID=194338 RepID=A0A663M9C3_ATHCN